MKAKKKKAKSKMHKPDWPLMFADRIINLENRMDAVERAQAKLNAAIMPKEEGK